MNPPSAYPLQVFIGKQKPRWPHAGASFFQQLSQLGESFQRSKVEGIDAHVPLGVRPLSPASFLYCSMASQSLPKPLSSGSMQG